MIMPFQDRRRNAKHMEKEIVICIDDVSNPMTWSMSHPLYRDKHHYPNGSFLGAQELKWRNAVRSLAISPGITTRNV